MDYTVGQLARLSGVSARTIRFYDQKGLLHPARVGENGYRAYGREQVDHLQQILFYRELDMPLPEIARILSEKGFDRARALEGHLKELGKRRARIDALMRTAEKAIREMKGEIEMEDREKFDGFGQALVAENEARYGEEIRARYGDQEVDRANAFVSGMRREDFERAKELEARMGEKLRAAMAAGDPGCAAAREACALHREWLKAFYPGYTREYHLGLSEMHVEDARFHAYYEAVAPKAAEFLRDALRLFLKD